MSITTIFFRSVSVGVLATAVVAACHGEYVALLVFAAVFALMWHAPTIFFDDYGSK